MYVVLVVRAKSSYLQVELSHVASCRFVTCRLKILFRSNFHTLVDLGPCTTDGQECSTKYSCTNPKKHYPQVKQAKLSLDQFRTLHEELHFQMPTIY